MSKPEWRKRAIGGWGKPMYWVYGPADNRGRADRYTPTGKYNDCVSFKSVREAKRFIEHQYGRDPIRRTATQGGRNVLPRQRPVYPGTR